MVTLDEKMDNEKHYVVHEYISGFIARGTEHFNNNLTDEFYVDDNIVIPVPLEDPLDVSVILADDYYELGLWIPTEPTNNDYRAIMTVWASGDTNENRTIRFLYLTIDGRLVLCRAEVDYVQLFAVTLDDIMVKFFA